MVVAMSYFDETANLLQATLSNTFTDPQVTTWRY